MLTGALFVAQVGVARRFGFLGLGEYTATSLAVYLATMISMLAIPVAASRHVGYLQERGEREAASRTAGAGLSVVLCLAAISGVALALLWDRLAASLLDRQVVAAPAVAAAVVGSAVIAYGIRILQARLEVAAAGLVAMAQPFAVVVALAWDSIAPGVRPSEMAVAGYLAGGLVGLLALAVAGAAPRADRVASLDLLRTAVRYAPVTYTNVLAVWVDRLVVSLVLGPAALGLYQAAAALSEGSLRLLRGAGPFLVSAYGRAAAIGELPGVRLRRLSVRLWTTYAAVIAGALIAGADGIVTTLYGPGFASAIGPLLVLAVALVPTAVALTLLTAGVGLEQPTALVIARIAIPFQLTLGIALASTLGVVGVAAAQVAVMVPVAAVQLHWTRDPAFGLARGMGLRLLMLGALAPAAAFALQIVPLPWPVRATAGAIAAAMLGAMLLLESEERFVMRRLLALRAPGPRSGS